jgi:hypothetical protein
VIGVTGHRDLPADVAPLERAVREILTEFGARHPWSKIVVLSSLAEGADRLVARLALELGISLVVPMPLEQSDYESDFKTADSLREFRALLQRADAAFVVPPAAEVSTGGHASRDARSRAYANCGAFLVRKSIEIIALWDGVSQPVRGTAEVVTFQLEGVPAPYVAERKELDLTLVGPVKHVATRRGTRPDASPSDRPIARTIYPRVLAGARTERAFEKAKADIDRFNRDVVRDAPRGSARTIREDAAAVANDYRSRTVLALGTIFAMVFLSIVGFNAYGNLPGRPLWLLCAYVACSALAFFAYYVSKRGDWQNRHQDCRALSEVLRVAHYWDMAGIDEPAADVFAENHRAEIDWLPFAIRTITEPLPGKQGPGSSRDAVANLRRVYDDWLVHEYRYFTTFAGRRERWRSEISARVVSVALILSILLTVAMRLLPRLGISDDLNRTALLVATVLAVVAALLASYADKRGWTEHVRRYDMMAVLFGRAREKVADLLQNGEPDDDAVRRIRDILRNLGEEAIRESAAWLSLHRSRPIDVPQA